VFLVFLVFVDFYSTIPFGNTINDSIR
jgi:hypothetical protein